jgi:hypothetical protein
LYMLIASAVGSLEQDDILRILVRSDKTHTIEV